MKLQVAGERATLAGVAVCAAAAAFLFIDRATMPIELWDESRNMVSALEMAAHGARLIPSYDGLPDLWNTKPPLLIWLMAACVRLFGASEMALRLPSMIAATGTVALVYAFTFRTTRSIATAAAASALLVLSPAFFGEHSARTADYDALLLFFVTAALMLLFGAVERQNPSSRLLAAIGTALVCGFLTKSIAALVPLAGVALYVALTGRWRVVTTRGYWLLASGVMASVVMYALLCEAALPGFFAITWANNVGTRFASAMGQSTSPRFYLHELSAGYFAATPLLLLAPITLWFARPTDRRVLLYAVCVVVTTVAVYSIPSWRLDHYILPALPFMAIVAAITAMSLLSQARLLFGRGAIRTVVASIIIIIVATPLLRGLAAGVARRYAVAPGYVEPSEHYGELFAALANRKSHIQVIDPGIVLEGKPHYAAVLLAYREMRAARGVAIDHATSLNASSRDPGTILASCDENSARQLRARGHGIASLDGCEAVENID